ncbi:DUF3131 domain-containing protein [Edwardsiella tarda]
MRLPIGIGHRTLCRAPSAVSRHSPDTPEPRHRFSRPAAGAGLSFQEAIGARIAWQYFVNNTQASGLVNALDRQSYVSLWSIGDQLMATLAAERLGIISRAEFDRRLTATLQALATLPLSARQLPGSTMTASAYGPIHSRMRGHHLVCRRHRPPAQRATGLS